MSFVETQLPLLLSNNGSLRTASTRGAPNPQLDSLQYRCQSPFPRGEHGQTDKGTSSVVQGGTLQSGSLSGYLLTEEKYPKYPTHQESKPPPVPVDRSHTRRPRGRTRRLRNSLTDPEGPRPFFIRPGDRSGLRTAPLSRTDRSSRRMS